MTEEESVKYMLNDNVSLAVYNGGKTVTFNERGIKTLLRLVQEDRSVLIGATVADKIVGKAAALLFVNGGVMRVYGEVMSVSATKVLRAHGIKYSYGTLTDRIINRKGTDICPMEKAVAACSDPNGAVGVLMAALEKFNKQ